MIENNNNNNNNNNNVNNQNVGNVAPRNNSVNNNLNKNVNNTDRPNIKTNNGEQPSQPKKTFFKPRTNMNKPKMDAKPMAINSEEEVADQNTIWGRNSILEALKVDRKIDKLFVLAGESTGSLKVIVAKAKQAGITVMEVQKMKLDEICSRTFNGSANHQGVVAYLPVKDYVEVEDILNRAKELNEDPFIVVLDELTDTMNVGAIIRTAECCGVHGIIMPKRRSAGLNSTVAKISSGAIEHMLVAQVANLNNTLENLKKKGMWIIGADMEGQTIYSADLKGPTAFVIGAEGKGIGTLIKKNCDFLVKVPMKGKVKSLNASVAAGVVLYEKLRQEM